MIAVVLKGWPRLSETFIARELEALEARGLTLDLWSLRHPTDTRRHPAHDRVRAHVAYLPEYLHQEPARVFRAWAKLRRTPGYRAAKALFRADWKRDRTRNRLRRFGQALVLAAEMKPDTRALYAHFIHTPGSVARYAAALTGLPYAASAHARDIWTTPDWDLRDKVTGASFVTTCTQDGHTRLAHIVTGKGPSSPPANLHLNHHGLDLKDWPRPSGRPACDGRSPDSAVTLLSVGRAVEKKGYGQLLQLLARLDPGLHWRFVHIGGGPLLLDLKAKAASLLPGRPIEWRGSQTEDAVRQAMREADIFILTPTIAEDGDRDGLPNVLVEAQSQGLPVVATAVGGVSELIVNKINGYAVTPGNLDPLVHVLTMLITQPDQRHRMGAEGRTRVETHFAAAPGADAIAQMLRNMMRAA